MNKVQRFTVSQLLCILLVACNSTQSDNGLQPLTDSNPTNVDLGDPPIIDVQVKFDDTVFTSKSEIGFGITLLNSSNSDQTVLFDKPRLATGGPWNTSAEIKQLDVRESQLHYVSNLVMNSNTRSVSELLDSSHVLAPGEYISGHYNISDLLTLSIPGNKLNPGRYEIQVFHAGNASNKVVVRIEE